MYVLYMLNFYVIDISYYLQVSWVEDVATAGSGERPIKLYDEAGYAAFKKGRFDFIL